MTTAASRIVHRETIALHITAAQVKTFIITPERILDYYPDGFDGGVIEAGRSIYCRAKSGISLLELVEEESYDKKIVVKVTTASHIKPPYTKDRIKAATFFTMIEDWEIEPTDQGSVLTKTWRDIKKYKMKFMPMSFLVRRGAKSESAVLQKAWNKAV
ncbi:MAG: hypothetical protein V7711_04070 [Pseudomonadales bacterium]